MDEPVPMEFKNGLTEQQEDLIYDMTAVMSRMIEDIERLPRHRSLSLAVTKLDEAKHWLNDRKHRAPQLE